MNTALTFPASQSHAARAEDPLRVDYALLALVSVLLHVCGWLWFQQPREQPVPVVPPRVVQLMLVSPAPPPVPPPAIVQPPPPVTEPPPPVIEAQAPLPEPVPKPKPKPRPKPKPAKAKPKPPAPPTPIEIAPVNPAPPVATAPATVAPPAPVTEPVVEPASTRATSRRNPKPDYPTLAKRRGWEGKVLLEVEVLSDGMPGELRVSSSSGREVLDNAALEAVKRWMFEPARRADVPITSTLTLSIVFKLEN